MDEQAYQAWCHQNGAFLKRFLEENLQVNVDVDTSESKDYYGRVTGYDSDVRVNVEVDFFDFSE